MPPLIQRAAQHSEDRQHTEQQEADLQRFPDIDARDEKESRRVDRDDPENQRVVAAEPDDRSGQRKRIHRIDCAGRRAEHGNGYRQVQQPDNGQRDARHAAEVIRRPPDARTDDELCQRPLLVGRIQHLDRQYGRLLEPIRRGIDEHVRVLEEPRQHQEAHDQAVQPAMRGELEAHREQDDQHHRRGFERADQITQQHMASMPTSAATVERRGAATRAGLCLQCQRPISSSG